MPRPSKLSEEAIEQHLASLPAWKRVGNAIERTYKVANFVSALGFINAVGICAEVADHHPDITLFGWNNVRITLSTHDQGGLTELDFALARKIDEIAM